MPADGPTGRQSSPYVDAEAEEIRDDPYASSIHEQYLTARSDVTVRSEAATVQGRAKRWTDVVEAFESYLWRQFEAAETWADEKGVRPTSHRFTHEGATDRYARTLGVDRAARRLWGEDVTTVHMVRRARPFGREGQPQPPADHLADLLAGNHNVYRAIERHVGEQHGLTYARCSVLEPHRNGYAHIHDGLWVEDPDNVVSGVDVQPAIDAHLQAVDQAQRRTHGPDAVSVYHDPDTRSWPSDPKGSPPTTALPRELTKYLGGFAPHDGDRDPSAPPATQADTGPLRFYALLWATNTSQWRHDETVFPRLVEASQEWFGSDADADDTDDANTYADPSTTTGSVDMTTVDERPVAFDPFVAD